MSNIKENSREMKMAVAIACSHIEKRGYVLHSAGNDAWDIETPFGWVAINSSQELVSYGIRIRKENDASQSAVDSEFANALGDSYCLARRIASELGNVLRDSKETEQSDVDSAVEIRTKLAAILADLIH